MKRLLPLLLALSAPCIADLDLAPRFTTRIQGGYAQERAYFTDGQRKYAVPMKGDLEISAHEGGAIFRFKSIAMASMRLRRSPLRADLAFGPESLASYEQAALKLLPSDCEEPAIVERIAEPLAINGWKGLRFTLTYTNASGANSESITFLNVTPTQQIVIQTAAKRANFEEAMSRADSIMRRWFEIPPEGEPDAN